MPENLFKRGGTYYARFAVAGEIRRVSLRTPDLREAKARLKGLREQQEDAKRRSFGIEVSPLWTEAVEAYIAGVLDQGGVKPGTAKRYIVSLGQVDPYLGTLRLADITLAKVGQFVRARQQAGTTNATIRRDLTTMSRVLAFARANSMVAVNVVADYDRSFLGEKRPAINAPDDQTIAEAVRLCRTKDKPEMGELIEFLRATGMRTGEALRATSADIHDAQLTIHETKNGRVRTIDVGEAAIPKHMGKLFSGLPSNPAELAKAWDRIRVGLPEVKRFRLHDLRHAYAIAEIRKGRDIYDLSHHLGHSSVRVTEIYLGYTSGGRAKARTG
jgi:integrase/recombinase XerD